MSKIWILHIKQLVWHVRIDLAQLLCCCLWCWLRHVWADQSEETSYSGGGTLKSSQPVLVVTQNKIMNLKMCITFPLKNTISDKEIQVLSNDLQPSFAVSQNMTVLKLTFNWRYISCGRCASAAGCCRAASRCVSSSVGVCVDGDAGFNDCWIAWPCSECKEGTCREDIKTLLTYDEVLMWKKINYNKSLITRIPKSSLLTHHRVPQTY